ncbi:Tat pathway signal protein [Rhodoferax sp. TH121]|uniref:DUF1501 domain-containing protein n=1 Tax=Rhodoferax sp. TH121 TaxID=2022803 RepID=UPI000B96A507|nr:DUF1501 domain-containing protein [Rhodoferax sp. TH121]OYQ38830.1 Tat pathway signal protein [Rhodoferax sp. TH121]
MSMLPPEFQSRRAFLRRSGQLALSGTALPFALNLAAIGEAAAFNAPAGDYKALVCVFLFGGNDYANTVVAYDDPSYNQYSTIRGGGAGQTAGGIALAKAALTPTRLVPLTPPVDTLGATTREYALHPAMTGLANLFNTGKAAVQLNVGPLVVPLTRAQYNNSNRTLYPRPPQLFSHNDQQSLWQSSSPEGSKVGWGGNMGDVVLQNSLNSNSLFSCMSVSGNAVFLAGDTALQYQVSTSGAIKIRPATDTTVYGSSSVRSTIDSLIRQSRTHKLENEYNVVTARALAAEASVTNALALSPPAFGTAPNLRPFQATFGTDALSTQLQMVARLIKGRNVLGARRQVFFVSMGGFDLHDNLVAQQATLMGRLSTAMTAFYEATNEMGVANQVTAFTASDFGRTLASNGDGSDHGWGSHHLVVGGAVNGQRFYGVAPPISVSDAKDAGGNYLPENAWHVGQGRLLPRTSVDQYAATLAKWFGVTDAEMPGVLPKITNFGTAASRPDYPTDLGFMQ